MVLLGSLRYALLFVRGNGDRYRGTPTRQSIVALRRFSRPNTLAQLLKVAYENVDNLLVGWLFGIEALGLYAVAYRLPAVLIDLSAVSMNAVVLPELAQSTGTPAQLAERATVRLKQAWFLAAPAFAYLAASSDRIVITVFGEQWRAASGLVVGLSLLGVTVFVRRFLRSILLTVQRVRAVAVLDLVAVATLSIAILLSSLGGFQSLAPAVGLHGFLLVWVELAVVSKVSPVSASHVVSALALPAFCAALMGVGLVLLGRRLSTSPVDTLLMALLGGLSYLAAFVLFDRSFVGSLVRAIRPS